MGQSPGSDDISSLHALNEVSRMVATHSTAAKERTLLFAIEHQHLALLSKESVTFSGSRRRYR